MKMTRRQHAILGSLLDHIASDDLLDIYELPDESPLDQALGDWIDGEPRCCCTRARRVITALMLSPEQYGFKPKSRRALDKLVFKELRAQNEKIVEVLDHMERIELRRLTAQAERRRLTGAEPQENP